MDAFRVALLGLIGSALAIGLFHRIRAARAQREKLDRRQEGLLILVSLRLTGLVFWLAALLWIFLPSAMKWAELGLTPRARWAGVCLAIPVVVWLYWVFRTLGNNITDTVVTRREHTLVTTGPYRWVRNPLYTGVVPLGFAIGLIQSNCPGPCRWLGSCCWPYAREKKRRISSRDSGPHTASIWAAPGVSYPGCTRRRRDCDQAAVVQSKNV